MNSTDTTSQNKNKQSEFPHAWKMTARRVHQSTISKGFWDESRNKAECIALMHSELSEALEALRNGNPKDDKIPEFTNHEVELADVVIRIMDYAEAYNLNVGRAIIAKMAYNETRPYKHGKAF